MKNKVLRVLLGCVLGAMLVPVTAAVPAESAKNNKKEV